jgi:hypothetical protein
MYLSQFLTDATVSQIVQSSACAFVASVGYFSSYKLLGRQRRWKATRDKINESAIAVAINRAAHAIALGLIWYGCFSAVRTFGIPGTS